MTIGSDGTVYLAGYTQSQDFPYTISGLAQQVLPNGYESGSFDIFATAIDPTLTKLTYSVHLGQGFSISMALGPTGNLYVTGTSVLSILPLENAIVSDVDSGGFFMELNPLGMPLMVSKFGGHAYIDSPSAIAVDTSGNVYLAGSGSPAFGSGLLQTHFDFPDGFQNYSDPILVGAGVGNNNGAPFAKIGTANSPQVSLNNAVGPFLTLRNAGSADLHISAITLGGGLSEQWGNCGGTIPAGTSCILTVSGSGGLTATGTVTISSDAEPSVQTFPVTLLPGILPRQPIGNQLWSLDINSYFPPQFQGTTTAAIPLTVWNVGTANATLNSITATGDLSETDNCGTQTPGGAVLAPGANCVVQVSMTANGQSGGLGFVYDTTGSEGYTFYVIDTSPTQLLLSSTSINFGTQMTGGVAIPRVVTVTNAGNTFFPAPAASIQGDTEFILQGNTCTSALAPHQSCELAVQFDPTANGTPTASLDVSGLEVALSGTGEITSAVTVSPLGLDFIMVVYPESAVQPLTLTNTTGSAIGITGISFSLPDYSETDNCNGQVPANGSCTLQVKITPQQLGVRNGTVIINFSNGAVTQVVSIAGSVILPLTVTPSSLDFGSTTAVGSTSTLQGVGLANGTSGVNQPFTTTIVGDFVVTPNGCTTFVPPFTSCGFGVAFQPKTAGFQQGSLTFNLPGIPFPLVVTLTGSTPKFPTTTALMSSLNPSSSGDSVTIIATVTSTAAGTPTGTATFFDGATQLAPPFVLNAQSSASYISSSLSVGSHAVTAQYSGDTNFTASISPVLTQQVSGPSFSVTANPTTVNVSAPGQSGTTTLMITAQNGFSSNGAVTITPTCMGLPSESSCSSGASVTIPVNGTVTAPLVFPTTAPSALAPGSRHVPAGLDNWMPLNIVTLACVFWVSMLLLATRRKPRLHGAIFLLIACGFVVAAAACGGGGPPPIANPGTPVGLSNVTVSVTINGVTENLPITLNVQ